MSPIPINEDGAYVIGNELHPDGKKNRWKCTSECKPLTDTGVDAILGILSVVQWKR